MFDIRDTDWKRLQENAIGYIKQDDPWFPYVFQGMKPLVKQLFWMGNWDVILQPLLAIVGPRKPSVYLLDVMSHLSASLWSYALGIISWGARGIDMLAHQYALQQGIPTVVVLGGWLRRHMQREHEKFFQQVVDAGGVIISDFDLDTEPTTRTFPLRNRIVAWLSQCVFLPWAAKESWSLLTVDYANTFGIPVFSVPWSLFDITCAWTNQYIADKKLSVAIDFDQMLGRYFTRKDASMQEQKQELNEQEHAIISLLRESSLSTECVVSRLQWSFGDVLVTLSCLEMKGMIKAVGPGEWGLSKI